MDYLGNLVKHAGDHIDDPVRGVVCGLNLQNLDIPVRNDQKTDGLDGNSAPEPPPNGVFGLEVGSSDPPVAKPNDTLKPE